MFTNGLIVMNTLWCHSKYTRMAGSHGFSPIIGAQPLEVLLLFGDSVRDTSLRAIAAVGVGDWHFLGRVGKYCVNVYDALLLSSTRSRDTRLADIEFIIITNYCQKS